MGDALDDGEVFAISFTEGQIRRTIRSVIGEEPSSQAVESVADCIRLEFEDNLEGRIVAMFLAYQEEIGDD
jgi:hypothetical protein